MLEAVLTNSNTPRSTSSVAAGTGGVIGPQYASSKAALHGLIHWLSLRYCKEGIVSLDSPEAQVAVLTIKPYRTVDERCGTGFD